MSHSRLPAVKPRTGKRPSELYTTLTNEQKDTCMNEQGWMFHGGGTDSCSIDIGRVSIIRRTAKRVYLDRNIGAKYSGYRECVPSEEVYPNEVACRKAAAEKVAATKAYFDEIIDRMTRVILGQPEKKEHL